MPKQKTLNDWVSQVVGAVNTSFADSDRAAYGELAPDVVAWPGSVEEIVSVLQAARDAGAEVAVAGSGTRTLHHWPARDGDNADDQRPRIALDTSRLANILRVDDTSQLVECQTGLQLRYLEDALQRQGLTLGSFPDSMYRSTLGGVLGDPPPLAYSALTGPLHESCLAITAVTPEGDVVSTRVAPRRAAGPDISRIYVGSGAALGVMVSAVMRVHNVPEAKMARAFLFPGPAPALSCARAMLAGGLRPARLRVMGNERSAAQVVMKQFPIKAALAVAFEGAAELVALDARRAEELAAEHEGGELPQQFADHWAERYPDPGEEEYHRSWAPVLHSDAAAAGEAVSRELAEDLHCVCYDQFSPHRCNIWSSIAEGVPEERLERALVAAKLSPARHGRRAPLAQRVRQQLDPTGMMLSPKWH